ncbi:M3 family oligoendopeptidase [Bombella pollinis]|uniref:M3 family oligoendopeptidase n=1 Tax=Bombella pollinis TaxID=2967337 RepID=A0ABT3WKU8_9PROT|nr:M3 family oligoendopeptidase [Bombella pollinis]MCX5619752.1 M3 family oligoendopeptidase [Bombella pollinis]
MMTSFLTSPSSVSASGPVAAPRWDLSDLYISPEDPALESDFIRLTAEAQSFETRWKGKLGKASAAELAHALQGYEVIEEGLGKIGSYAQLLFAAHTTEASVGRFAQSVRERLTALSAHLLFFPLELNRLDDAVLEAGFQENKDLASWQSYLRDLRVFRPYQLSDEVERVLMDMAVSGRNAWVRLFDETMAGLMVHFEGKDQPLGDVFNYLTDSQRERREAAAKAISATLAAENKLLVGITNTLAKDKATTDAMRGYPRPVSSRNRANMVEDEVVDALVDAVQAAFPRLSHRYYSMKARWLGLEQLEHWDRNAPLPDVQDKRLSWDEGKAIVHRAYQDFDEEMGRHAHSFLSNPWIDAAAVPGKSSGAFAHPVVPSVHPYLLMNYHGRPRDVMTLAHEMGHGIHQMLAGQKQGYLRSNTPLTLAETASVFGEMLTFQSLLDGESDAKCRHHLLASKVEDMLNTVVRQIAFYLFEVQVHDERRKGEIPAERLGEIWRDVQTRSLGPAFHFTPDYDLYWSYIPHFIHSPFYVYAYAFGDCLVNALYGVYQDSPAGFAGKYKEMLAAGGTLRHQELLAPFGLNAGEPSFWTRGLDVISGLIDQLEATPHS